MCNQYIWFSYVCFLLHFSLKVINLNHDGFIPFFSCTIEPISWLCLIPKDMIISLPTLIKFIQNLWVNFLRNDVLNIIIKFNLCINSINRRNIFPEFRHPFCSQLSFLYLNCWILNFKCNFSTSKVWICLCFPRSLIIKLNG